MKELSIIVPVYNTEKYIIQCVRSILSQNFSQFELILVDDGSLDSSGKICDRFAEIDDRVHVIHKSNGGLMSAWKTGVKAAHGEYIGFVDSDDWIDGDMFSTLVEKIESDNSDMVACGMIKEYIDRCEAEDNILRDGLYNRCQIEEKIYPYFLNGNTYKRRGILPNRVVKVIKKAFFQDIIDGLDNEITIGEDLLTTFCLIQRVNSISIMNGYCPYHYRIHSESMINKYKDQTYQKIELLHNRMLSAVLSDKEVFERQINTDFVKLMFCHLDEEILFSGKTRNELRKSIKNRFAQKSFLGILKESDINVMSIKYKVYVLFIKLHFWDLIILIRRAKKVN